jgi:hypothetical protein
MITLPSIPSGLSEITRFYGVPWETLPSGERVPSEKWKKKNLTSVTFPHPFRYSWKDETLYSFLCHRLISSALQDALMEIGSYGGWKWLKENNFDRWGGCYNPRNKRGSDEPSTHYFGIAIDFNPHLSPLNQPSKMPWFIVNAFAKRGFVNLEKDGMHFQACSEY